MIVPVNQTVRLQFWAHRPEHRTMEEFEAYLREVGNEVLMVDRENDRILIGDTE